MAFSVRISGYHKGSSTAAWSIEPRWWEPKSLLKYKQFETKNETGSYQDYLADFTPEELKEAHEFYKSSMKEGVFADSSWKSIIAPQLEKLDTALDEDGNEYSHFEVLVFEWESGY